MPTDEDEDTPSIDVHQPGRSGEAGLGPRKVDGTPPDAVGARDDKSGGPEGKERDMPDQDIHVVEQGDGWEVWRIGDSMPLGSYVTQGEAEERAAAQATIDGGQVIEHGAGFGADDSSPATEP